MLLRIEGPGTRLTLKQVRRKLGFEETSLEEALLQKQRQQASILREDGMTHFPCAWHLVSCSTTVMISHFAVAMV